MSQRDRLVTRLFRVPGDGGRESESILGQTAEAHRTLLKCAASEPAARRTGGQLLPPLGALLERLPGQAVRRFLVDPAFVEGLHRAARVSRTLAEWHHRVAEPSISNVSPPADHASAHRLGNSLLALSLREDPHWRGRIGLRTDVYGRLRFPLSDWTISLSRTADGTGCVLSDELVTASLTRHEVRLSLGGQSGCDLLIVPRDEWLRMILGNDPRLDGGRIGFCSSDVTTRLQFASPVPGWRVRYEPVSLGRGEGHSALTGGVVAAVLNAIAHHSPAIGREFDVLMSAVRGWELPAATYGTIQSFSDPTLPRVMGINVPYGPDDEPRISPFCFTWFGHELGHTKSYLIETILHVRGEALTTNPADYTDVIERYGRALSLRTLLQVPYTHLYEWALLMGFLEGGFAALPWEIDDDPVEFGEDIHQEIVEAFDLIERESRLTPCGRAAVSRLHGLRSEALVRWQSVCGRKPLIGKA